MYIKINIITEIKKLLANELNFYEETVFLYTTEYFEFKKDSNNSIAKMKQVIQVF
ncbi:Rgg family transcriptional regulator [Streptococcus sp. AS20]|uniref:Rgg family transcriptional regulator n=1 Tax=Streptococcus sp. AS20 TaxID=936578 RepID=UPI002FBF05FB